MDRMRSGWTVVGCLVVLTACDGRIEATGPVPEVGDARGDSATTRPDGATGDSSRPIDAGAPGWDAGPTVMPPGTCDDIAGLHVDVGSLCGDCSDERDRADVAVDRPWCTLAHAFEHVEPGDTVYIKEGRYLAPKTVVVSGEPDAPIRWVAVGDRVEVGVAIDLAGAELSPTAGRAGVYDMAWSNSYDRVQQSRFDPIDVDDPNPSRFELRAEDGPLSLTAADDLSQVEAHEGTYRIEDGRLYLRPLGDRAPADAGLFAVRGGPLVVEDDVAYNVFEGIVFRYLGSMLVLGHDNAFRGTYTNGFVDLRGSGNVLEDVTVSHAIVRTTRTFLWYEKGSGHGIAVRGQGNVVRDVHVFHSWNLFSLEGSGHWVDGAHLHGSPNHCFQPNEFSNTVVSNLTTYNCQDGIGYIAGGVHDVVFEHFVTQDGPALQEYEEPNTSITFRNGIFHGCRVQMVAHNQSCAFEATVRIESCLFLCDGEIEIEHCTTPGDPSGDFYPLDEYRARCADGTLSGCMQIVDVSVVGSGYEAVLAGGRWPGETDDWDPRLAGPGSPAVDRGAAVIVTDRDLDGDPRPVGSAPDIGVDELEAE